MLKHRAPRIAGVGAFVAGLIAGDAGCLLAGILQFMTVRPNLAIVGTFLAPLFASQFDRHVK